MRVWSARTCSYCVDSSCGDVVMVMMILIQESSSASRVSDAIRGLTLVAAAAQAAAAEAEVSATSEAAVVSGDTVSAVDAAARYNSVLKADKV